MKAFFVFGMVLLFSAVIVFAGDEDLPRTVAELNRWYVEPPPGQNAATKILEGFAALTITEADSNSPVLPRIGKGQLPPPDKPVPPEMKAAMTEFIQRNRPALSVFSQAAQLQQSRYPIDLNRGIYTLLPHGPKIKQVARILELASISHGIGGQSNEAGRDLLTIFAVAQSLEYEPVLISQLLRASCLAIAVDALNQTLNRITLSAHTLEQLQETLRRCEERDAAGFGFTRGFVGEEVSDLREFGMAPEQYLIVPENATPEERKKFELKIKEAMTADRDYLQATFDQALAMRKQSFPTRLMPDFFAQAESVATNRNLLLSGILLSSRDVVSSKEAANLATLRLAQTAVALEQFRYDHANRFPDSLTELTPNHLKSVPEDPFDGKPLRYRKAGDGYVLYSIGRNLKDDGGEPGSGTNGDIVFSVINPPAGNP